MSFGERLITVRKEHGYTRESLAQELGISKFTLRNYELEATEPGHTFLKQISDFFNVSVDYLMELSEEKERMTSYNLKSSEYDHIKRYRFISEYSPEGTETVDYILNREYKIAEQIKKLIQEHVQPEASEIDIAEKADVKSQPSLSTGDLDALSLGRASNQQTKRKA